MIELPRVVLPPVPEDSTPRQRFGLAGQGVLDTIRQYAARARDAGEKDIADEFDILFARAFMFLRGVIEG